MNHSDSLNSNLFSDTIRRLLRQYLYCVKVAMRKQISIIRHNTCFSGIKRAAGMEALACASPLPTLRGIA
eukprot:768681-Hanusia_phi.AAC.12